MVITSNKNYSTLRTIIILNIFFFLYFNYSPPVIASNPTLTDISVKEKKLLDSLNTIITQWFDNSILSEDEILFKLDSIQRPVINDYGAESLSNAYILHKKGVAYYRKGCKEDVDYLNDALWHYQEALKIRMLYINHTDKEKVIPDIIRGYNNIGGCYLKLKQPYNSIKNLLKALKIIYENSDIENSTKLIYSLNTLCARTYCEIGDYDNALLFYSKIINSSILKVDQESDDNLLQWKIRALIEAGGIQALYLKQPKMALPNLNLALSQLLQRNSSDDYVLLADCFHNLGLTYWLMQDYKQSEIYYNKSIVLNYKLNLPSSLAKNYLMTGILFYELEKPDSSEFYLMKAGKMYSAVGANFKWSYIYDNLGDVEYKRGNFMKSLEYDNRALKILLPGFQPKTINAVPIITKDAIISDKQGVLISLSSKAGTLLELYRRKGDIRYLQSSLNHFLAADTVMGLIRSEFIADASKFTLVETAKTVYEQAIEACMELYKIDPDSKWFDMSFAFSEKSRAIVLLDAVRKIKAENLIPDDLQRKEKEYNLMMNYYEKQLALENQDDEKSGTDINLIDTLLLYRRKYAELLNTIRDQYPDYFNLIYNQSAINTEIIKNLLSENQSLIEYFVGDKNIYLFYIGKDTTVMLKGEHTDSVQQWVSRFNSFIQQQDLLFALPAYKLYNSLIYPLKEKIQLPEKLIIIPDDVLSTLCFDALVTRNTSTEKSIIPDSEDYLLSEYQLAYSFSASMYRETYNKTANNGKTFLGIAPSFKKGIYFNDEYFQPLDNNEKEITQIKGILGGRILTGTAISIDNLRNYLAEYTIIHFATHAKANNENGNLSFIILNPDKPEVIYAKDLYTLGLNANLVVLSACETGTGSLNKGEGIISLARGFFYSGVSSIVTSLWDVREGSNTEIIKKFYAGLKSGLTKDQALRNAKIDYLKSIVSENSIKTHPYFWAPLICIGNMNPVEVTKSKHLIIYITCSILLLSLLIWLVIRYDFKKK